MGLFRDIFALNPTLFEENFMKDHPMWVYYEGPTRVQVTCPNCHKITWLEERFALPHLPKLFVCFYCGHETMLKKRVEETNERDES